MALTGMDIDQIRSVGGQLKGQAAAVEGVIATIEGLISQAISNWMGPDAVQFQDWWNSQHRPALQNAAAAIDGLGQSAMNNADAQEQVSNS